MVQHAEKIGTNDEQQPGRASWSPYIVHIKVTVTGLDSPIIPFAILKENPLSAFEEHLASIGQQAKTQAELLRAVIDAWNRPFAELRPEELFFVCAWSSVAGACARVMRAAGLYVGVATSGVPPTFARYVTTKAVLREGKWVAWCMPVGMQGEMEGRRVCEVELGKENVIEFLPE